MRHAPRSLPLAAAALALVALAAPAAASAEEPPSWTLQVDPLTTALGFAHVQIERALADQLSVYAGPHLRLYDSVLADTTEDYIGVGLEAGVRWFFLGGAPEGWWAQVRGVAARLQQDEGSPSTAFGGYVSALGGYTFIGGGWLVLAGGAGVQYIHYRIGDLGPRGVLPAAHTTVGVAF